MNIVVVGYGRAGRQHAAALDGATGATLHSVLETDPTIDTGSLPRAESWPQVLADPDIHAVSLCTPPGGRAEFAMAALAAGKSVLLEKPPCMTTAELDAIDAAAQRHRVTVAVMLQHRHVLPQPVLDAAWGGETTGTVLVSRPRHGSHFTGWRGRATDAQGGITAHLGVHYLDLACQVLGQPAELVLGAWGGPAPGIDTRCAGTVRFISGAVLTFAVTAQAAARAERLTLVGNPGRLEITDGAVSAEIDGEASTAAAVPASVLRRRILDEFAAACDGAPLRRAGLSSSRAVTWVLDELHRAGKP